MPIMTPFTFAPSATLEEIRRESVRIAGASDAVDCRQPRNLLFQLLTGLGGVGAVLQRTRDCQSAKGMTVFDTQPLSVLTYWYWY